MEGRIFGQKRPVAEIPEPLALLAFHGIALDDRLEKIHRAVDSEAWRGQTVEPGPVVAGAEVVLQEAEVVGEAVSGAASAPTHGPCERERAEFTNFRTRTARERAEERGLAGVDLIGKVLSLADDFDRAIETRPAAFDGDAWADGIAAIDRKLRVLLESEGVTQVEADPGMPFDPRHHEAITSVPGTGRPEGEIVAEIRHGYRLRDRVIRPALVAVAAAPDGADATGPVN